MIGHMKPGQLYHYNIIALLCHKARGIHDFILATKSPVWIIIILYWMALRGIQEYIARDNDNIARVEDEGYIVSIKGNIFLYPPKKSHPILLLLFI